MDYAKPDDFAKIKALVTAVSSSNQYCNIKKCSKISIKFREKGNSLFSNSLNDETCIKILSLYTQSIAYAPGNSEELACGFGNRSALLYHMKKFQECIIDIDKALSITKSDALKAKLSSRKLKSINEFKLHLEKDTLHDNETISFKRNLSKITPSKTTPCVSEKLSLKQNKKYGKHYVANQPIKPGEFIAIETAYVAFPRADKLYVVCSHCLSVPLNGVPCSYCSIAIYCSEDCKNQAWEEYHDVECSIAQYTLLPKITKKFKILEGTEERFQFIYRYFIKIIKNHGLENIVQEVKQPDFKTSSDIFVCNPFQSCYNMARHIPEIQSKYINLIVDKFLFKSIDALAKLENIFTPKVRSSFESEEEMLNFVKQLFIRFAEITTVNGFAFGNRGSVIEPCCSFFNHSCFPNAQHFFAEKSKIMIYVNQPIKTGEQLFINYKALNITTQTTKERRKYLEDHYSFICNCQPCSEDWCLFPETYKPGQKVDKLVWKRVLEQYDEFCVKEKMKPVLRTNGFFAVPKNIETLRQILYIIELIYKYFDPYDLAEELFVWKDVIGKIFAMWYDEINY